MDNLVILPPHQVYPGMYVLSMDDTWTEVVECYYHIDRYWYLKVRLPDQTIRSGSVSADSKLKVNVPDRILRYMSFSDRLRILLEKHILDVRTNERPTTETRDALISEITAWHIHCFHDNNLPIDSR